MAISFAPRQWLYILLGLTFVAYIFFQARFLILGPSITIESPQDGATVSESLILISGTARNAAWLSLNGSQIYTDKEGRWEEKLLLSPGISIMTASVRDRLGRQAEVSIRIILK